MRPRKLPNQNCAVSNQLVDGGRVGGVLGETMNLLMYEGEYVQYSLIEMVTK
jgi:hypothetical protein